jgi:SEC-C motif-containing protein
MRSRYSAYVRRDSAYLKASWHPSTRPPGDLLPPMSVKWLGLKVMRVENGGEGDNRGVVEFVARLKPGSGPAERLHEVSRFVRETGPWLYLSGDRFAK